MTSFFTTQIQVISDLHLETPLIRPLYKSFKLKSPADYLLLLGDIGLCKDDGLYNFLERVLKSNPATKILYVMGNHEAYQMTLNEARQKLQEFSDRMSFSYGNRFILLNQRRYNLNASTTILGCTLWSRISPEQATEVASRLTDFNEHRGIRNRSIEQHNADHEADLQWLNEQVQSISRDEPRRQIIIATHHSPTLDLRGTDPRHVGSSVSTGFATDLSKEPCWTSPNVRMWAFGHTHFSLSFHDEMGKLVIAEQKGYNRPEDFSTPRMPAVVVDVEGKRWEVNKIETDPEAERVSKMSTKRGAEGNAATVSKSEQPPVMTGLKAVWRRILGR